MNEDNPIYLHDWINLLKHFNIFRRMNIIYHNVLANDDIIETECYLTNVLNIANTRPTKLLA